MGTTVAMGFALHPITATKKGCASKFQGHNLDRSNGASNNISLALMLFFFFDAQFVVAPKTSQAKTNIYPRTYVHLDKALTGYIV